MPEALLEKYNKPVPRYTSYPTANNFTDIITADEYLGMVALSNKRNPENIAFYFHIPFCKKICYYCGCNSCRLQSDNEHENYHKALKKEIRMVSGMIDKKRTLTQVHFGGGTPNAVPLSYLAEIIDLVSEEFNLAADAEIAVECNPALLGREEADKLKEAGFNRFSLGIQDFNEEVLKLVNRDPSLLPVNEIIDYIKRGDDKIAVNLDFIYGLPGQTAASFEKTVEEAALIRPDRLVTFSYAHVPWLKKNQSILEKYGLPAPREKVQMFLAAYKILKESNYMPVGLDHYVLPEDELYVALQNKILHRNFQGYCTRRTTGQVYAFGVTAISQLEPGYFQNTKSIKDYIKNIDRSRLPVEKGRILTGEEKIIREVISQLMCNKYINWDMISKIMYTEPSVIRDSLRIDKNALDGFADDGLLEYDKDYIRVTETGSMFIRNIAASLDPDYKAEKNKYSKSV
ncbi:MAG: oxygen-independent coproporphyrinogen III oxidase [Bacteroidales bacterium]|nr:oxygen-independent coproporphyrinogen III oxidase [Bacteroidales bacterium]